MAVKVFCAWCSKHEFRVDVNAVDEVGTIWIVCPQCGQATGVSDDFPRGLVVRPARPPQEAAAPEEDIVESEWLHAAARNPAFDELGRAEEEIYSLEDGKPFRDEG